MNKLKLKVAEPAGEASKVRDSEVSVMVSSGNVMISRKESSVLQSSNRFSASRPSASQAAQSNRNNQRTEAPLHPQIFRGDDNMSEMMDTEFELIDHQRRQLLLISHQNHGGWAKRKRSKTELKQIIQRMKSQMLIRVFISKMKVNAATVHPLKEDEYLKQCSKDSICQTVEPSIVGEIIKILFLIIVWILLPVGVTFPHLTHSFSYIFLQTLALLYTFGRLLSMLKAEINKYWYWRFEGLMKVFWSATKELLLIVCLIIDLSCANSSTKYLSLIVLSYCPETIQRVGNLQKKWFTFVFWYKYGLILKTLLLNSLIAHFLCCFVIILRYFQSTTNWLINNTEHIKNSFKDYLLNYQWALSTIFSSGFGIDSPNDPSEAVFLIVVQIFSCGLFLYNLIKILKYYTGKSSEKNNLVEKQMIISKLKEQDELSQNTLNEVKKKLREKSIIQSIQQSRVEELVLKELPQTLQNKIKIERYSQPLGYLPYFKHLSTETVQKFAQSLEIYTAYPGELIKSFQTNYDIFMLKKGAMSFVSMHSHDRLSDCQTSQIIEIDKYKKLSILGLQYLSRKLPKYGLMATTYATVITLKEDDINHILRQARKALDKEFWAMFRDKCQFQVQFQVFGCPNCIDCHTKFECPKLHYIPYRSIVIAKEQDKERRIKLLRKTEFERIAFKRSNALTNLYFKENNNKKKRKAEKKQDLDPALDIEDTGKINEFMKKNELNNNQDLNTLKNEIAESILAYKNKFRPSDIDEVWTVKSDSLKDYRHYFPKCNPSCLMTL